MDAFDEYKFAALGDDEKAVEIIKEAETAISRLTGNAVTLIAYEKTEEES